MAVREMREVGERRGKNWQRGVVPVGWEALGVVGRMLDVGCWMPDARALLRSLRPAWSRQKPLRNKNKEWWWWWARRDDAAQERGTNEAEEHWLARFVGREGLAGSLVAWDVV